MRGRYIRKHIPGRMHDPTMTYVDDPQAFAAGEYIVSDEGVYLIVKMDDALFNNPDIRFAQTEQSDRSLHDLQTQHPNARIHDVRKAVR